MRIRLEIAVVIMTAVAIISLLTAVIAWQAKNAWTVASSIVSVTVSITAVIILIRRLRQED
jgi:hypothetical protein